MKSKLIKYIFNTLMGVIILVPAILLAQTEYRKMVLVAYLALLFIWSIWNSVIWKKN
jgi:hypothetical protein